MEDIVTVLDGREEIETEVGGAPRDVREYLVNALASALRDEVFITALPRHLPGDPASQATLPLLISRLGRIAKW